MDRRPLYWVNDGWEVHVHSDICLYIICIGQTLEWIFNAVFASRNEETSEQPESPCKHIAAGREVLYEFKYIRRCH